MIDDYFKRNHEPGLWSIEILTILYMLYTTVLLIFYWDDMNNRSEMVITRLTVAAVIMAMKMIYDRFPMRVLRLLRVALMMLFLISWYPETYDFCCHLPYKDHIFAMIDHKMFGYQPALEFSKAVSSDFWCEAFCMGYYLYYYMMAYTIMYYLVKIYDKADKAGFIFMGSFFVYYIIYEWLPVAGPQYYFKAVGEQCAQTGVFPDVADYFRYNTECLSLDIRGLFSNLVVGAQEIGERPTAAFPSSHVGMSTVTMILLYRTGDRLSFYCVLPVYLLLCCGTVYIKAHYCIDSIAGFFSAIIVYVLLYVLYDRLMRTRYAALVGKR